MPRAILSVYDKTDLVKFATTLVDLGWDLVASGGTESTIRDAGLPVASIDQLTGVPELLGGRVKTLHPAIHAGILARDNQGDMNSLQKYGYAPINMVVCNLYPFQETVAQPGVTLQDAIEQIDIGGVTLLRAAAKNFWRVAVICDSNDYTKIAAELRASAEIDLATRRNLAIKAFSHTRDYDTAIHAFLSKDVTSSLGAVELPQHLSIGMQRIENLRYGENPHQAAAFYSRTAHTNPLGGTVLGGKQLSYNNILDVDAAWRTVSSFAESTVAIVKHLNPTGIATSSTIAQAFSYALTSDPVSAFGGVIASNRIVDDDFVNALSDLFVEAIVAPEFAPSAQRRLSQGRKNCRLVQVPQSLSNELEIRSVMGGLLAQTPDLGDPEGSIFKSVANRSPTASEMAAMQFGWKCVRHVKSNAVVLASENATVGIGGGLPSRVDAVQLALKKAGTRSQGAILASDAFFPFPDGVEVAAEAGVTAIIQPGGSIRDKEIIEVANKLNVAMVFTGIRHFLH